MTEPGIRLEIQCGEAVIKYIDLRILGNGSGNRQTLLLTARDVITAL